jgi:hypothetical protein
MPMTNPTLRISRLGPRWVAPLLFGLLGFGASGVVAAAAPPASEPAAPSEPAAQASPQPAGLHYRIIETYNPFQGEVIVEQTDELVIGDSTEPLTTIEALEYMGLSDLAEQQRKRHRTRTGLRVSGTVLFLGGLSVGAVLFSFADCKIECPAAQAGVALMALGGVGGILAPVGFFMPDAVTKDELRVEFERYQRAQGQTASRLRSRRWSLTPALTRSGGGLWVSGRF